MGNIHSFSSEAIAASIVLVGGIAYYNYSQVSHPSIAQGAGPSTPASKKGKKKKKASASAEPTSTVEEEKAAPGVVGAPAVLPGQFDAESVASDEPSSQVQPKKSKKKKAKGKNATGTTITPAESVVVSSAESAIPVPPASTSKQKQKKKSPPANPSSSKPTVKSAPSIDTGTDGSWTRVESSSRRGKQRLNDPAVTTGTEDSSIADRTDDDVTHSPSTENRQTLAEKLLPKPRKTPVDEYVVLPSHTVRILLTL